MKIALCLYGHFRCFDDCWPNLRDHLMVPNGIHDVFAASWTDSMGHFQHPESCPNPRHHPGYDAASSAPAADYIATVESRLRPVNTNFQAFGAIEPRLAQMVEGLQRWHHPSVHHRPRGTLGQVHGRCTSIQLKRQHEREQGFTYDRVVVTRWDVDHPRPVVIRDLPDQVLTMDGMYGSNVISDAWACGPSRLADLWARQMDDIPFLIQEGTMSLGPHEWLRAHFDRHGIPWHNHPGLGVYIRR